MDLLIKKDADGVDALIKEHILIALDEDLQFLKSKIGGRNVSESQREHTTASWNCSPVNLASHDMKSLPEAYVAVYRSKT